MALYAAQVGRIEAARSLIERFYGERVIHTVTEGPTYLPPENVADLILQEHA